MNKIKNQLEETIKKELNNLLSTNYQFIVEGKHTDIFQINAVELHTHEDFDDELRDGNSHLVSLWGIVAVKDKSQNGYVPDNLIFRESNVEIKFDWNSMEFSISNVGLFRFNKSKF
jgi:hypothetical protein